MLLPRASTRRAPLARAWDEALLVRGEGGRSTRHAHHWWHLVIGLDAPLRASGPDGVELEARAILTPPDVAHAITASGEIALLYVEPEGRIAACLRAACPDVRVLSDREAEPLVDALDREPTEAVMALLLEVLGAPEPAPIRAHPAIAKVLRHLEQAPSDADVSLDTLAALAGLSSSRFLHAFTEHVGLPLRPYVRWLRVRRAAGMLLGGAPASEAAHGAGFADAAHMSRTFREMFGVTPSEIARRSQSVQSG
ncbi:helix-turn-helix domain-containing protein [Sandaracinus amylolyticus]|uniref:Transcriptional regulator, AraC family protein n=1 Tax=Sandaracinus amylolyticus TaxID=927083 RepID=A0A0F6SDA0_9BACT|nr:AraC family transcriptional regulator [Sandaracinus amylolyticus]AKF03079.1 Transcriptional regulator, AraC family protein [Sandaracinus amylolyticus]